MQPRENSPHPREDSTAPGTSVFSLSGYTAAAPLGHNESNINYGKKELASIDTLPKHVSL